jgi:AAA family ATP:ADP antiporter
MHSSRIDNNRSTGLAAAVAATLMIAHHVAGKAMRDTLFLTQFDVTRLPQMMIIAALLSVAAVLGMSRLMAKLGPARLVPNLYALSSLLFLAEWLVMAIEPRLIGVVLYLHVTVVGAVLISGFWSVINERFDPYTAKGTIGRLAGFATLGGLLGGLGTKAVVEIADTHTLVLILGILHLICALSLAIVSRGQLQGIKTQAQSPRFFLKPLKDNPLIRGMTLLVALVAITVALLDYLFKSTVAATLTKEELIHFFSYFYMAVSLGSFLLQTLAGNKALRRLGLGGVMAAWPIVILVGGTLALVVKHLLTITLLRAGANLFYNSFFRAGFEVLYTPIPAGDKRTSKVLIDVGADRAGDMIGSLIIMALLSFPAATGALLTGIAVLLSGVCLLIIFLLHRGYVHQLADNLRSGSLRPEEIETLDTTTRQTVTATQTALERDKLLAQIAQSRQNGHKISFSPLQPLPVGNYDSVIMAIADLRSGQTERIQKVLAGQTITTTLLPHVILLLAEQDHLREVFRAIRPLASTATGQLVDALLDRRVHPVIRRRLPLILGQADNQWAINGLMVGLADEDWDVRLRCGQALQKLRENHRQLKFERTLLMHFIEQEIRFLKDAQPPLPAVSPPLEGHNSSEHLHHLFNLLGLVYGPEVFELCFQAVRGDDLRLRGTALEYMENLLPPDLRSAVWRLIAEGEVASRSGRTTQEMVRELLGAAHRLKGKKVVVERSQATTG